MVCFCNVSSIPHKGREAYSDSAVHGLMSPEGKEAGGQGSWPPPIRWQGNVSFLAVLEHQGRAGPPGLSHQDLCVCMEEKGIRYQPELFRMDLGGGHRDWKPACLRLVLPGPRWPSTLAKQKKKGTSRSPTRKLESHRHPFGVVPEGKCHNKGSSRQSSWMMCFYGVLSKPISMQTGWKAKREKGHVLPHTLPRPGWFR